MSKRLICLGNAKSCTNADGGRISENDVGPLFD